ncbi:MAG: hypothetical protein CVU40_10675 [Chloroflexi bacterium HGW-Chloroflexi-2]|nr:MAG: hypothetical protein CVU40_10675 [Chloroflexi bacterium HGW-Chloroflexi-2]
MGIIKRVFHQLFQNRRNFSMIWIVFLIFVNSGCTGQQPNPETNLPETIITIFDSPTSSNTLAATQEIISTDPITEPIVPTENISSSYTPEPTLTFTPDLSATTTLTPTITLTPTRTIIPSRTPYPTRTIRPSRTPIPTNTPTPSLAFFRINNIGPFSFVTSPIRPEAIVSPGEDGLIIVELMGEDGRTITKENINYQSYLGRRFGIAPEVSFELERVSEYGRLSIYTKDRYSRMLALTSVDLLLLQLGSNKITPPKDLTEPYIIRRPAPGDTIQGGVIVVQGLARILSASPIIIECIDPDGNIVGDATVEVEAPNQILSHIPFEAYIPYSVDESTNIRFTVRQESASRLPGTLYLYSFEITLEP